MIHLCILGMKKWKEIAFHRCYWLDTQRTLTALDEQLFGFHSPHSISFKMEPLGETLTD